MANKPFYVTFFGSPLFEDSLLRMRIRILCENLGERCALDPCSLGERM